MSAPSTPKRKARDTSGSYTTPSKKSKAAAMPEVQQPAIRSWVQARNPNRPVTSDPLPADKQHMFDLLKEYLNQIDEEAGPLKYQTAKNRVAERKIQTLLAMGSLYTPMSEEIWQLWRNRLSHGYPGVAFRYVNAVYASMQVVASAWLQEPPLEEQRSGIGRSSETSRAQETIHEWYEDICVITGQNMSQACHIIPSSAARNPKLHFWDALATFWPDDEILRLQDYLKTREGDLQNLMMFGAGIHIAWTKSRFAVKPIPTKDPYGLDLEFHYLSNIPGGSLEHTQGSDTTDIVDLRSPPYRKVQNGDVIHIRSRDKSQFLLPSADLLMVQYHLQRALRASAAGELLEILFRDDHSKPDAMKVDVEEWDDAGEADRAEPYTMPDPTFCNYLIDSAIAQRVIHRGTKVYWQGVLYGGGEKRITKVPARAESSLTPDLV